MSLNKKKVAIITGITSFLGRCTAKRLLEKGFIVFGIVRPDSDVSKLSNLISYNNESLGASNFYIIKLDFNSLSSNDFINVVDESISDNKTLEIINNIKNLHADITFIHFAWGATLDRTNFAKQMMNIDMSSKVLEFAKIIGANRFIFAGSQAELSESAYGMAKKEFANVATADLKNNKMKFIHFRIFSIYGKEDRETSLLKQLVKSFRENKDITLSSCEYKWNFLYIDDFTYIVYKFITKNVDTGTYDIASDDTRILKDYVIEAHNVFGANNKLLFGKRLDSLETFAIPDIKNTINAIGNMKFTKFSDGILKII